MARVLRATKRAERAYVADLKGIMRGVHAAFNAQAHRADGINKHTGPLQEIEVRVVGQMPDHVKSAFNRMATSVDAANKSGTKALLGVLPQDTGVSVEIAAARERNIRLVQDAARDYADAVGDILNDPDVWGLTSDSLATKLAKVAGVSESRAQLIARDQTLKLNGAINEARQTSAGITSYVWDTSHDERVRPEHAALDGRTFTWASPPSVGNPGEDFQCRCVAMPVIPEPDDDN